MHKLWESIAPSICYSEGNITQGKGQIIYLMAAAVIMGRIM